MDVSGLHTPRLDVALHGAWREAKLSGDCGHGESGVVEANHAVDVLLGGTLEASGDSLPLQVHLDGAPIDADLGGEFVPSGAGLVALNQASDMVATQLDGTLGFPAPRHNGGRGAEVELAVGLDGSLEWRWGRVGQPSREYHQNLELEAMTASVTGVVLCLIARPVAFGLMLDSYVTRLCTPPLYRV